MGVIEGCLGGYHPICNECGCQEIWEISPEEYNEKAWYWDNWTCPDCRAFHMDKENYENGSQESDRD